MTKGEMTQDESVYHTTNYRLGLCHEVVKSLIGRFIDSFTITIHIRGIEAENESVKILLSSILY